MAVHKLNRTLHRKKDRGNINLNQILSNLKSFFRSCTCLFELKNFRRDSAQSIHPRTPNFVLRLLRFFIYFGSACNFSFRHPRVKLSTPNLSTFFRFVKSNTTRTNFPRFPGLSQSLTYPNVPYEARINMHQASYFASFCLIWVLAV